MNVNPNNGNHAPEVRVVSGRTFDGVPFPIALEVNREIDHGATARIYKGEMLAGERLVVAVKVFGQMLGPVEQELLVRELRAARQVSLRHPLILAFLGTADTGQQTSIVSLYMRNGNLMEYLKSHPGCDKKALILQVAEGVNYLHTDEGLVHGDLKCANVLISDYGEALLADFGLSTFVEKSQSAMATMTGIRQLHTARFAAPELLFGTAPQSKTRESDVYAFGMLVLEAVTKQPPWWGVVATDLAVMMQVSEGRHPPQPTLSSGFVSISHHWWDVCKSCWIREPGRRPRMPSILDALQPASLEPCRLLNGHSDTVRSVAYLPGGRRVVSASVDKTIRVWDSLTGHTVLGPLLGYVTCLAVSPKGEQICSGGLDSTIRLWDAASGAAIGTPMSGHDEYVDGVAFSPDGMLIVSCSDDRTVRLWDASTGKALGDPLRDHTHPVYSVAFSPDGACIASGSLDGTICLWDTTTGVRLGSLKQGSLVNSVCFSPDRVHLVAADYNGVIRIWNVSTQQPARTIDTHSRAVNSVSVSPSGLYIASASEDQSIRIWDARTGDAIGAPLTGHTNWISSVVFSPDGRSLVSGSGDRTVRIWDLSEETL